MLVLALVGTVAACLAAVPVATQVPGVWKRTLGSRGHELRQVERLSVGQRIDHVEKRWGSEVRFSHAVAGDRVAAYFVTRWCVVQALYDKSNSAITAFVVTSRHPKFRPSFPIKGLDRKVQLLVTKFSDWPHPDVTRDLTTRYLTYVEELGAGNPGDHLSHQLAITPLGAGVLACPDRSAPVFRDNVVTTYGCSIAPWDFNDPAAVSIGGSTYDLRHVLPKIARGGVGDVRG